MKKITKMLAWVFTGFMMACFLSACSFFETPAPDGAQTAGPQEHNSQGTVTDENAVTDETWHSLAENYSELEIHYESLKTAYETDQLQNPDVDALLEEASSLIKELGAAERGGLREQDGLELQQVIAGMDASIQELYAAIIPSDEEKKADKFSSPQPVEDAPAVPSKTQNVFDHKGITESVPAMAPVQEVPEKAETKPLMEENTDVPDEVEDKQEEKSSDTEIEKPAPKETEKQETSEQPEEVETDKKTQTSAQPRPLTLPQPQQAENHES